MHIIENVNVGFAGVKNGYTILSEYDRWGKTIDLVKITYFNTPFNFPSYKEICDVFLNSNPNGEIIFIGEDDMGGCTGSKALFEAYKFEEIVELDKHYIPDWGYHDGIFRATKIVK